MKVIRIFVLCIAMASPGSAQFTYRSTSKQDSKPVYSKVELYLSQPYELIDIPTASLVNSGDFIAGLRFYENGSLLGRLSVGLSRKMMFGVSFSGERIIGGDAVDWNDTPGVQIAYRIVDESLMFPALTLGLDTQGYGKYWQQNDYRDMGIIGESETVDPNQYMVDRYAIKPRGFYLVGSKGYQSFRNVDLHAGVSYSTDTNDPDKDPTIFMGIDIELSREVALIYEYDFGLNDDTIHYANNGNGYMNIGVRLAFPQSITVEFDLKNLLANESQFSGLRRILKLYYHGYIVK
ncbi:hypothetical protein GF407_02870 [candidate division KSB1 bacterium]|nr:hypothetical protein [candidate division KSB1 bacterium]